MMERVTLMMLIARQVCALLGNLTRSYSCGSLQECEGVVTSDTSLTGQPSRGSGQ
jgi:hypothetical protein